MTKMSAFMGEMVRMSRAPTTAPMYAPAMGMRAVTPTRVPMARAKGRRRTVMPRMHRTPRMTPSKQRPTM